MSDRLKYKVMKSDRLGRYLVSAEKLDKGSLIYTDVPFAIGPKPGSATVCLGCHRMWNEKYYCSKCSWPCCGEACEKIPMHRENECKVFAECGAKYQFVGDAVQPCMQYDCITPLRMLLAKERDPERWTNEVTVMEDHNEERKTYPTWESDDHNITKYLRGPCGLAERFDDELIQKVCGILEVNSVETPCHHGPNIRGIYPKFAIMSHNCVPTITHIIVSKDNNYFVEVRAAHELKEDVRLELSYTHVIGSSLQRRQHLKRSKFFDCICERCADPTELGTNISSLKCNKCELGVVTDTDPLDDNSNWKCSNCEYSATHESVVGVVNLIEDEITKAEKTCFGQDLIEKKEQDLKWYSSILHPNHSLMLGLKYFLAQNYQDYTSTLVLRRKLELCKELLDIIDIISPGHTRMRGILLYEMHIPMVILAQKELSSGKITKDQYHEKIREIGKLLKECAEILLREDEKSYNGFIGKMAMNQYKELMDAMKANL